MLLKLVELFVKNLVDAPESVSVKEIKSLDKSLIEVRVHSRDLAKVIGKEGKTFKALRSLVRSISFDAHHDIVVDTNL